MLATDYSDTLQGGTTVKVSLAFRKFRRRSVWLSRGELRLHESFIEAHFHPEKSTSASDFLRADIQVVIIENSDSSGSFSDYLDQPLNVFSYSAYFC